ncbi:MAG TPA: FG-GAP-like repeat-containing protein, partial [Candidatus Polarisedimenticolia bacterium]|nr:FG-GAP-like repeat-containing protein [Candidatus Polarisedimenticolia bacterium]
MAWSLLVRRGSALAAALLLLLLPSAGRAIVDTDGDGLADAWEIANGFDPNVPGEQTLDPDLDGIDNLAEQAAGTDPHVADTDGDGLSDGAELARVRALGFGARQVISSNANSADSVFAIDLDGDGDLDVLSASFVDDKVAWYENRLNEPAGNISPERVITTTANGARSVFATDLDGDGDPDVLVASQLDDTIAWYENRLNEPSADFGPEQILSTVDDGATFVYAADLDGDGDPDVLSASAYHKEVAWFENRLNEPSADFGSRQVITNLANLVFCVRTGDLDGDGDPDVLSTSPNDDKVAWYENRLNEPSADFGPQQVVSVVPNRPHQVIAADFDRDGDLDLLTASEDDGRVAWYANRLNEPSADFGPIQDLTLSAPGA